MADRLQPKWSREIERFLPVKPHFVLWGNIYDVYPAYMNDNAVTLGLSDFLAETLTRAGYSLIICYTPLVGFSIARGEARLFHEITGENIPDASYLSATLPKASELIEQLVENKKAHVAVILLFSSRMQDICEGDARSFFYRMFLLSCRSTPKIPPAPAGGTKAMNTDKVEKASPKFNPVI